jgi:hypothetical protein
MSYNQYICGVKSNNRYYNINNVELNFDQVRKTGVV